MRTRLFILATLAALAVTHASALQPPEGDDQQITPEQRKIMECDDRGSTSLDRATTFLNSISHTDIPFEKGEGARKACGTIQRAIEELVDLRCPQEAIDLLVRARDAVNETREDVNEHYEMNFPCHTSPYE